ncbi:hypothetical protein HAX54_009855 [Datura stramonium]|uniref:Uncharacterized protein n=1 Tax=Datura stramonium TaxID=4076 RepID=A0ABS8TH51_DATST|nr:hypothetical protein [Datura stramonium]
MDQMLVRSSCTTQSMTHYTPQRLISRVVGTARGSPILVAQRLIQWIVGSPNRSFKLVVVQSPVPNNCTMTSIGNKKQQEAVARKKIAKRRQLRDELESDSSSGLEVHYNIETSDESLVVTTREKSKAQEAAAPTSSPPQSNEGSVEVASDGDNPPADNAEEGIDDTEESGDDDTDAEESGDKESVAEKSNEQVGDSKPATTPEARSKRWFL